MDKQFNFLLYKTADENVSVNALIKDDTIWLTQKTMAELFDCSTDNISLHLKIYFVRLFLIEKGHFKMSLYF